MKNLTTMIELAEAEMKDVIDLAFHYKRKFDLGIRKENVIDGKTVALIFEKPSLRTKVAFEQATNYLGGSAIFLSHGQIIASGSHEAGRESIPDIARNLERFSDLIVARVYSHKTIQEMAAHISKPLINALCDLHHPTQALADLMCIEWHKGKDTKVKVAYIGDGNNVATSLMHACAIKGHDFVHAAPDGFQIPEEQVTLAQQLISKGYRLGNLTAGAHGAKLEFFADPFEACLNADVIYTDTYISMGQEDEKEARLNAFLPYQVNLKMFNAAKSDANFMHCLPAHRGEEVSDEVMDHPRSVVFDQAECRMHIAKALIHTMLAE